MTFEEKMNRLKEIVEKLENDSISLDESIQLYQEGSKLAKELQDQLNSFQEKISEMEQPDHE